MEGQKEMIEDLLVLSESPSALVGWMGVLSWKVSIGLRAGYRALAIHMAMNRAPLLALLVFFEAFWSSWIWDVGSPVMVKGSKSAQRRHGRFAEE